MIDDLSPPKKRFAVPSFSGDRKLSTGDSWEEAYADFMGCAWREFVPAEDNLGRFKGEYRQSDVLSALRKV